MFLFMKVGARIYLETTARESIFAGIYGRDEGKLTATSTKGGLFMTVQKMDHPNDGIKCSVDTCYYYMNGDFCSAPRIHVGPHGASSSDQTDCNTFRKK